MPRRTKSEIAESNVNETPAPDAPKDAPQSIISADDQAIAEAQQDESSTSPRFIRHTFTSAKAGVRAGEDKRFNLPQVFVDFDDDKRATDQEKAELKEAGFRYRPSDKGYSALANAATREARDDLVQKFTERRLKEKAGKDEGQER